MGKSKSIDLGFKIILLKLRKLEQKIDRLQKGVNLVNYKNFDSIRFSDYCFDNIHKLPPIHYTLPETPTLPSEDKEVTADSSEDLLRSVDEGI